MRLERERKQTQVSRLNEDQYNQHAKYVPK